MNWREYITWNPDILGGQPCIKDTRVPVTVILDNLAAGLNADKILISYPTVSRKAIQATLGYAAELARETRDLFFMQPGNPVPMIVILEKLAAGQSAAEVTASYLRLPEEAIQDVLFFAAELARENASRWPITREPNWESP